MACIVTLIVWHSMIIWLSLISWNYGFSMICMISRVLLNSILDNVHGIISKNANSINMLLGSNIHGEDRYLIINTEWCLSKLFNFL